MSRFATNLAQLGRVEAGPSLAAPPGAEVFGALPAQTHAALSADGHWLAWMDHTDVKPHIVIFDLQAHKVRRVGAWFRTRNPSGWRRR
jgi:hypothetical protein